MANGLEKLKSIFSEGSGINNSQIGGRHGGIVRNIPPHPEHHSEFDDNAETNYSQIGGRHVMFGPTGTPLHKPQHSLFDNGGGINNSQIGGRHGGVVLDQPPHPSGHSIFDHDGVGNIPWGFASNGLIQGIPLPYAFDNTGGTPIIDNIFTPWMPVFGGVDIEGVIISPFTATQNYFTDMTSITSLHANKLGFDNSANGGLDLAGYSNNSVGDVNPENESINFGIQWTNSLTPSNITLSGINEDALGFLEWFSISGDTFSIDHAQGMASFNFSGTPIPTRYEETVWELPSPTTRHATWDADVDGVQGVMPHIIPDDSWRLDPTVRNDYNYPYRGIIFQVRDESNLNQKQRTTFVSNRIPPETSNLAEGFFNGLLGDIGGLQASGDNWNLGEFLSVDVPGGFGITGTGSDISFNFRPRINFDSAAFIAVIKRGMKQRATQALEQEVDEWKNDFRQHYSTTGEHYRSLVSGFAPDLDADNTYLSVMTSPSLGGLQTGGIGFAGTIGSYINAIDSGDFNLDAPVTSDIYKQLRKNLTDKYYPGFGGVAWKGTSPRGLSNPEATEYKEGEPLLNQTPPAQNAKDSEIVTAPSAGPYSNLEHAVDHFTTHHYSPKGHELSTMLGSIETNSHTYADGKTKKGDYMTLLPIGTTVHKPDDYVKVLANKKGMQFFFLDKRNMNIITFRGYLEAITENVSPTWTPENYIGKSEPNWIYERAERDISFQLKLYAQTKDELDSIYNKINALTSFCYPQYQQDDKFLVSNIPGGKMRMKPPLLEIRMGNLYGQENAGLNGFIKSLTYSVPDNADWHVGTDGIIVPKMFTVSITYQVIHKSSPNLYTPFYGLGTYEDWTQT